MNKIVIVILSLIMVSFTSCESFFDLKPHDSSETSNVLKNEADAQTMLNGVYLSFKTSSSYGKNLTVLTDIMTDAALASTGFTNQMGQMYAWNINPGSGEVSGVWANHYSTIYTANYLINNLSTIEGDQANLDRIMAEALTARAALHYNLVRLFGKTYNSASSSEDLGVPYMFTNELGQPKRNSVEEVYQYILADINQANTLWGDDVEEANEAYFTSSFAKGLGARVALDMKDYESVVSFTSDIINTGIYSLSSDISFINMWLNDESEEVIWRVRYTATDYGVAPGYNFYNRNNNEDLPKPDYLPAEWLTNLYNSNDIRDSIYFQITKTDFGWSGVLINKYPTNPMFDQQGTNMPKPMRLAEIYLMRAEAYAYLDQDELAADDMDVLLSHRLDIHSGVSLTGDALKEFIFTERIKELVFEGFYWFDLKRMKKGFERVPQEHTSAFNDLKINADDYRWQWPIPTIEINGNPNIKQNPGY